MAKLVFDLITDYGPSLALVGVTAEAVMLRWTARRR